MKTIADNEMFDTIINSGFMCNMLYNVDTDVFKDIRLTLGFSIYEQYYKNLNKSLHSYRVASDDKKLDKKIKDTILYEIYLFHNEKDAVLFASIIPNYYNICYSEVLKVYAVGVDFYLSNCKSNSYYYSDKYNRIVKRFNDYYKSIQTIGKDDSKDDSCFENYEF